MIHICYALYDAEGKYSKNIGTSMLSIFENTKEWITIHLLHDNTLTEVNKELFIKLARKYGQHICFYNMDELDLPSMAAASEWGAKSRFSKAALYRLFVGEVLPLDIQRLIYLDSDIIVNLDIRELWDEELKGAPIGAVSEDEITYHHMVPKPIIDEGTVEKHRYFCSGVLLIDMAAFSTVKDIVKHGLQMLEEHPEYTTHDQDILNYYFAATYQPLNIRYDLFVEAERLMGYGEIKPAIYHYAGKAFWVYSGDVFDRLWAKYYTMSPWFTGDTFCDACRISAIAMADSLNSFWLFARGRKFTLVGDSRYIERVQKLLNLGQGDRFLSLYGNSGHIDIGRIITDMKNHMSDTGRSKPLYMFVTPCYEQFCQQISEVGFKEGDDFLNAIWLIDALEHRYPKAVENFIWDNI